MKRINYSYPTSGFIRPIKELLIFQRTGKFLTPKEKKEIVKYAEVQRRKNINNKRK